VSRPRTVFSLVLVLAIGCAAALAAGIPPPASRPTAARDEWGGDPQFAGTSWRSPSLAARLPNTWRWFLAIDRNRDTIDSRPGRTAG
jgi:hypothetical protein